ncbi:hypothetical protein SDC9_174181 [bioreactor metagenome]|uniref:Uncharacterized protein n=1 Tax=bioreactor metagenome TaxID=1076179 RepID=A0A645GKL4_9ZZZZ
MSEFERLDRVGMRGHQAAEEVCHLGLRPLDQREAVAQGRKRARDHRHQAAAIVLSELGLDAPDQVRHHVLEAQLETRLGARPQGCRHQDADPDPEQEIAQVGLEQHPFEGTPHPDRGVDRHHLPVLDLLEGALGA